MTDGETRRTEKLSGKNKLKSKKTRKKKAYLLRAKFSKYSRENHPVILMYYSNKLIINKEFVTRNLQTHVVRQ